METQEGSGRGGEGEKEEESKFWSSLDPIMYLLLKIYEATTKQISKNLLNLEDIQMYV